jgi:branched-chain amino acid transport system permease protein
MNYLLHILILISIYSILSLSLNLLVGYAGLISFCHASFYGAGAYISTLLMMKAGFAFIPAFIIAIVGSVLISFLVSLPSLRLRGDYFVLATLGFQIIFFSLLYNWISLTRGPYGIPGIPQPKFFGLQIDSMGSYFVFSAVLALLCGLFVYLVGHSPFGRVLKAIREDEVYTAALGKNVMLYKVKAFALAAGLAAVSGVLFAGYMRYIDPTSFTMNESLFIISIIIIGGTGNQAGPLIGTVLMILLPEILRFLKIPDAIAANMREIIYGLLIILIMRYRPQGIKGEFKFQ